MNLFRCRTHSAFANTAVFPAILSNRVDVNKIVMGSHSQVRPIYETERMWVVILDTYTTNHKFGV